MEHNQKANRIIHTATFANPQRYRMVVGLTSMVAILEKKHRSYLSSILIEFNKLCIKLSDIKDDSFRKYLCRITKEDYKRRTDELFSKYDKDLVTHLKCYIHAKLNDTAHGK